MSVVKDFFKLRKYNIHEVNEQIHKSQKNSKIEDGKVNNEATEPEDRTASKDDTHSTTVDNPACAQDNTESQENSGELLNQNSSHVSSVTKEPKDEGESQNCQDNNLVKWNLAHTGICCYMDIITHRGVLNEVFGKRPRFPWGYLTYLKPENADPFSYSFEYKCMLLNFFVKCFKKLLHFNLELLH